MDEATHGWNTLEDYLHVHRRVVNDHRFVISTSDALSTDLSSEAGDIAGQLACYGDVVVDVDKHFEISMGSRQLLARTVRYSYHARYADGPDILRYDNSHSHEGSGHTTTHHKHDFRSGEEIVTQITHWPHLSDVLDELRGIVWS